MGATLNRLLHRCHVMNIEGVSAITGGSMDLGSYPTRYNLDNRYGIEVRYSYFDLV